VLLLCIGTCVSTPSTFAELVEIPRDIAEVRVGKRAEPPPTWC
jgi:hypothetical protein